MNLIVKTSKEKVKAQIFNNVKAAYRKSYPAIKRAVKELIQTEMLVAFNESPTVQSIKTGSLRAHLGLQTPEANIDAIFDKLVRSIIIELKPGKNLFELKIAVGQQDFMDVLSIGAAEQDWTSADESEILGPPLPWLEWLLFEGDSNIIKGHDFSTRGVGRSDQPGIMIPRKNWRIPDGHGGTASKNFLTDIFDKVSKEIDNKLWPTVRPVLTQAF